MYACFYCGRAIRRTVVHYNPPILAIRLGADFPRAYHPACYERAEREAGRELWPATDKAAK